MGRTLAVLDVLRVADFTIIDHVELVCGPGLNVLTGETGAGKSIIVDALSLLLGARASGALVRSGARQAEIEGVFDISGIPATRDILAAEDLPVDDQLVLRRVISAEGKSRAYVNGRLVTLATVAALRDTLCDFHGQHEHQSLLRPQQQLHLLDATAGLTEQRRAFAGVVAQFRDAIARRDALKAQQRDKAQRLATLEEDAERLDAVGLHPGAGDAWRRERGRLANVETLRAALADTVRYLADAVDNTPTAADLLARAVDALRAAAAHDDSLTAQADALAGAQEITQDVARTLDAYAENLESDPAALDAIEEKLHALDRLKRRYAVESVDELLALRAQCADEVAALQHTEQDLAAAERDYAAACEETAQQAVALSDARAAAAARLEKALTKAVRTLGMPHGTLKIAVDRDTAEDGELPGEDTRYRLRDSGIDRVGFLFSANKGQAPRPLREVASGGELSRVMLALKASQAGDIPLLVFDEIDAGIGGNVGVAVADRLADLGAARQVFCVTHLPQIAARANCHWSVDKRTSKNRTVAYVCEVRGADRAQELARMFGDQEAPDTALEHAQALLARAQ